MNDIIFKKLDEMQEFYEKRKVFLIDKHAGFAAARCDIKIETIKEVKDVLLQVRINNEMYGI